MLDSACPRTRVRPRPLGRCGLHASTRLTPISSSSTPERHRRPRVGCNGETTRGTGPTLGTARSLQNATSVSRLGDLDAAHDAFLRALGCQRIYDLGPMKGEDNRMAEHLNVHPCAVVNRLRFYRGGSGPDLRCSSTRETPEGAPKGMMNPEADAVRVREGDAGERTAVRVRHEIVSGRRMRPGQPHPAGRLRQALQREPHPRS